MGKTCGNCKHWIARPRNPMDLGSLPEGECRGGPPQLVVLPTPRGMALQVLYPVTPAPFPGCSRFVAGVVTEEAP